MSVDLEKNKKYINDLKVQNNIDDETINIYKMDINWFLNNHFDCPIDSNIEECKQATKGFMDDLIFENDRFYRTKSPCGHTIYKRRKEKYLSKFLFVDFDPINTKPLFYKDNIKNIDLFLKNYSDIEEYAKKYKISKAEFNDKKALVKYFIDSINKNNGVGVFATGPMGIGKTSLMQVLAIYAVNKLNKTVAFSSVSNLINKVKESFNSFENYSESIITKLQKADILFLDDIGGEPATEWMRDDLLFTILNYRMENKKATYFTSNFSINSLKDMYFVKIQKNYSDTIENNSIKNDRFFERINNLSKEIYINGVNHRKK